jgi:hypothetical protein
MFKASATCCFIYSLQISTIAFFTAFTHYITVSKGAFSSVIYRYVLNTSSIRTKPFKLAVLLRALNAIYSTISLLILKILTVII